MINIAVFIDFKHDNLTNNSKSLLSFANKLVENNAEAQLYLSTVQNINKCYVPATVKTESITCFTIDNNVHFSSNASLDIVVSHLIDTKITHIFCTKSTTNDLIFAKLSMILNFNIIW